jgi:hypothetical protein
MVAKPVEWVLVVYYGSAAHRATYGRLSGTTYTKDYLQLSRTNSFLSAVRRAFSVSAGATAPIDLTYQWPTGSAKGEFVFISADRPHLKWETRQGAPKAWRMTPRPTDSIDETIPGDPKHLNSTDADNELALIAARGAGQPYLFAVKLVDEPKTLHLRVFLKDPNPKFGWADLNRVPIELRALAAATSARRALAWKLFDRGSPSGSRLMFDQAKNHGAWEITTAPKTLPVPSSSSTTEGGDAEFERTEYDASQLDAYTKQIKDGNYTVPNKHSVATTRGSAQRAFAAAVKKNYQDRCAVTDIVTKDFLVAAHIVPWSEDETIRLDPSNGICLSPIIDRAFELGYLLIEDDFTIRVDPKKVGGDRALLEYLKPYDGKKLNRPRRDAPKPEYLKRRRDRSGRT